MRWMKPGLTDLVPKETKSRWERYFNLASVFVF